MRTPSVIGRELSGIVEQASRVLERVLAHPECADRKGGVLCATRDDGSLMLLAHLGDVADAGKRAKYQSLAREKCERLSWDAHAKTSFASRDPAKERWGGGIRTPYALFAFSGLPEKMDEALVLAVAVMLGYLSVYEAEAIAKEGDNQYLNGVLFPRD